MSAATEPVITLARWQTTPASLGVVTELAHALREQSLAEPGCLGYEVFRNTDEPAELVLLERYRDAAALEAHRQSPHYQALVVARIRPLLTQRQVELLSPTTAQA